MPEEIRNFKLSPSDFGFLLQECQACYYDKYVSKKYRPRYNMPGIFTIIDGLMTSFFDNKPTSYISKELPPGIITLGGVQVKSRPMLVKDFNCNITIDGKVDSLIQFEDDTIGVIDFKTTTPQKKTAEHYFSQLMCYTLALENPYDPNFIKTCSVSKLGLCCFSPKHFGEGVDNVGLMGDLEWIEIEKDKVKFKQILKDVAKLLTGPRPEPNAYCSYCNFKNS